MRTVILSSCFFNSSILLSRELEDDSFWGLFCVGSFFLDAKNAEKVLPHIINHYLIRINSNRVITITITHSLIISTLHFSVFYMPKVPKQPIKKAFARNHKTTRLSESAIIAVCE